METPKLSRMGYLTLALLAFFTVESVLVFWAAVARIPGGPEPSTAFTMVPFVTFGLLLFVLVWGGQKAGFLGGLAYGLVNFATSILAVAGAFGTLAPESLAGTIPSVIVSLILVWSGGVAWREQT
jgi:hypothetical protein